ncbi:MAG: hypothetical protein NZ523_07660 [Elioraea sp.]|nr:hypothetical protein [Elioraea sp.]
MTTPSLTRRDFTLVVLTAPAGCAADMAAAQAPQRQAPPRPQPQRPAPPEPLPRRGPGDVAAVALRAAASAPGILLTLAQAFPPGAVPRDGRLGVRLEGEREIRPAQLTVLSRHRDGSLRTALITVAAPPLPADRPRGALVSITEGRSL